ncbi:MAG: hypothetical protein ACJA0Q_000954, partial [Saprospiraceae bacterium]
NALNNVLNSELIVTGLAIKSRTVFLRPMLRF